jgi:hypothetical protein
MSARALKSTFDLHDPFLEVDLRPDRHQVFEDRAGRVQLHGFTLGRCHQVYDPANSRAEIADEMADRAVEGAPLNILDRDLKFLGFSPVITRLSGNSVILGPDRDFLAEGHRHGELVPLIHVSLFTSHCRLSDLRATFSRLVAEHHGLGRVTGRLPSLSLRQAGLVDLMLGCEIRCRAETALRRTEDETAFACHSSDTAAHIAYKIIDVESWSLVVNDWEPDISVE